MQPAGVVALSRVQADGMMKQIEHAPCYRRRRWWADESRRRVARCWMRSSNNRLFRLDCEEQPAQQSR